MEEQLTRIKEKLAELKKLDSGFTLFGANRHRYQLNAPLTASAITRFEDEHGIKLPDGYAAFLTTLGNGGAGPYYGLEPLENGLFTNLDYPDEASLLNPSQPFLLTEPWNMEFNPTVDDEEHEEEYDQQRTDFEEIYYNEAQMNGVIAICNFGCGVSLNLVVNGAEYGHIWTDDRGSDNGIYPSDELGNSGKITFLDWYELWLDNSLAKITNPVTSEGQTKPSSHSASQKSWWKFW